MKATVEWVDKIKEEEPQLVLEKLEAGDWFLWADKDDDEEPKLFTNEPGLVYSVPGRREGIWSGKSPVTRIKVHLQCERL